MEFQKLFNLLRCIGLGCLTLLCIILVILPAEPQLLDRMIQVNFIFTFLALLCAVVLPRKASLIFSPALLLVTTAFRLSTHLASLRSILLIGYGSLKIYCVSIFFTEGNFIIKSIVFLSIIIILCFLIFKCTNKVRNFISYFNKINKNILDNSSNKLTSDGVKNATDTTVTFMEDKDKIKFENERLIKLLTISKFIRVEAILSIIITLMGVFGGYFMGTHIIEMPIHDVVQNYILLAFEDGFVFLSLSFLTALATFMITPRLIENIENGKSSRKSLLISKVFSKISLLFAAGFLIIPSLFWGVPFCLCFLLANLFGLIAFFIQSFCVSKLHIKVN